MFYLISSSTFKQEGRRERILCKVNEEVEEEEGVHRYAEVLVLFLEVRFGGFLAPTVCYHLPFARFVSGSVLRGTAVSRS
jgi:hypothetical protein